MPNLNFSTEQNLLTMEKALKENYLPALENMLNTEPSPILAKIKKPKLTSDIITASAPVGLSGGFGFGAEGQATPTSGNVIIEGFKTRSKDLYVNICISEKSVKLTDSKGSMLNALHTEMTGAYETANWNVGRSIYGNGMGILTECESVENSTTIKVSSTKYLKEGLIIDIYASNAAVGDAPQANGALKRIKAIDYEANTITLFGNPITLDNGFITVQNSYGREITGIGAIFDDNITSLYGVSKNDNPFMKPIVMSGNNDIDDGLITRGLRAAQDLKGSKIDMLLCSPEAYDNYVAYLRANNVRVEAVTKTIEGGFKSISFLFGNREADILCENFIPTGEIWGIDSSMLEFHNTGWTFATLQGSSIFNLMNDSSSYRALLTNYGELLCKKPGGCVRFHSCA